MYQTLHSIIQSISTRFDLKNSALLLLLVSLSFSAFSVATARSLGISSRTTCRAYREVGADLQSSKELREPLVDFILLLMLQKQIVLSTG